MNRILIILLTILALLFILYFWLTPKKQQKEQLPPIPVAPSFSPRPSYYPRQFMPQPTPVNVTPLQVVSVEPKEDLSQDHNPVTEIKFTFSDDIDLDNFLLEVSPDTQIRIIPDTTTHSYTISPKQFWPVGTVTFTIKQGTKSLSGASLTDTFTYKINVQFPKNPPDDTEL